MTQALVIGGGFSGAMTAAQLVARAVATTVVEPGELGRGIAYADGPHTLVLNTPAAAMSALPDRPDDFVAWLAAHGDRRVFAPRAAYGAYIREKLAGVPQVRARAFDLVPWASGYLVACSDRELRWAPYIVLALGNAPPRTPRILRGFGAYWPDPYRAMLELPIDHALGESVSTPLVQPSGTALDESTSPSLVRRTNGFPEGMPIALLGTGLTALDVVATLRQRGHRGSIIAISRRGLVPMRHPGIPAQISVAPPSERTLAGLLRWWRGSADITAKLDAIRPLLPALWQGLSETDRARFVRHVRPRWETVRHRAPPEVHAELAGIEIIAGALTTARMIPDGLRISVGPRTLDVAAIVNCTGPERDLAKIADPLIQNLLRRGLVARDALGLGAAALAPNLHAVGPWRIATEWESTAIGELRAQAVAVADAISAATSAARDTESPAADGAAGR